MPRLACACVSLCVVLAMAACAEGGSIEGEGGGGSGLGGANASTDASTTGPSSSSSSSAAGAGDEGGAMGTGGEPAVGGMGEGAGPACNFAAVEDCATAEPLPAVAGDDDAPPVIRMGDSSKWFKVHIEEQVSGISGEDMSYTVSLTSPPGMNYDLHVRQGAQDGSPECNATVKNGAGTPESVADGWNDDQGFGGEDDSLWLVIEVLYVSGDDCGSGAQWTLSVQGHT